MEKFAIILAVLIAACVVIMLQALAVSRDLAFIGGLIVVSLVCWFMDQAN